MNAPERSAALARVLASEPVGLPQDFAAQVAALAAVHEWRHWNWSNVALLGAFIAMMGVCAAGWFRAAPQESGVADWLAPILRAAASQPWLVIGVVGVATVQALTFRRRATS